MTNAAKTALGREAMTTRPLLTDDEIDNFGSMRIGNLGNVCYMDGARYARSIYEADRAKLLAEIARLEAMVPRWVKFLSDEQSALLDLGWASSMEADRISGYFVLMVPPIPLPEPKGGE